MRRMLLAAAITLLGPVGAIAAEHVVFFALGSAAIDATGRATISRAAEQFTATGASSISIVGHTDTTGPADLNMRLSQRRAEAVGRALIDAGVPAQAIVASWRGQTDLAVPTADGVAEPRNRRVEISVAEPDGTPVVEAAPAVERALFGLRIGAGPYVGFSFEDGDESVYVGANLFGSYFFTDNIAVSAETAVFQNTGSDDDGVGVRLLAGLDYHFGANLFGGRPYFGANVGHMWIDGSGTGGFTGGPELGLSFPGGIEAKLAYDFVERRDAAEGVISLTLGFNFLNF